MFSCQRGPVSKNIFVVEHVVVAATVVVYVLPLLGIQINDADVMDAEPESVGADSTGPEVHSWWDHAM